MDRSVKFPAAFYPEMGTFASDYFSNYRHAAESVDTGCLQKAAEILGRAIRLGGWVFVCGNGGSAAISNHMLCDHAKGIRTDTDLFPKVMSLSAHTELVTAIANDISYDEVFAYQLRGIAKPGDVLMTISSSGNSENIVRAVQWAKESDVRSISLTGFDGGRSAEIADVNIHVESRNYGVIEDVHQSVMHILAQYIRMTNMPEELIASRFF